MSAYQRVSLLHTGLCSIELYSRSESFDNTRGVFQVRRRFSVRTFPALGTRRIGWQKRLPSAGNVPTILDASGFFVFWPAEMHLSRQNRGVRADTPVLSRKSVLRLDWLFVRRSACDRGQVEPCGWFGQHGIDANAHAGCGCQHFAFAAAAIGGRKGGRQPAPAHAIPKEDRSIFM